MTLMGWLFATIIMSKEHSRALNQAWMIRAWWILQLLIGSLKLHAVICVKQQSPQSSSTEIISIVLMYTLLVVVGVLACANMGKLPRYAPIPTVVPSDDLAEIGLPARSLTREVFNWSRTVSCC